MPLFVFIESNTSGSGSTAIDRARERGLEVLFLTKDPSLYPFLEESLVSPVVIDTSDVNAIESQLKSELNVVGIWSTSEYYAWTAAKLAQARQLPCSNPEAIRICRDKGLLYQSLESAGIHCARTTVVCDSQDLSKLAPSVKFPVVIKPSEGSGSIQVRLVNSAEELIAYGDKIISQKTNERGLPRQTSLLIQEFVSGSEFSVEVVSLEDRIEVLGITRKHLGEMPYFVERGHDFPAVVEPDVAKSITDAVLDALQCVGYRFGPAHVECKYENGSTTIIEINPRLAGGMIPSLIERGLGIDVVGAMIDLYCGQPFTLHPTHHRHSAIRFAIATRSGFLHELTWADSIGEKCVNTTFVRTKEIGDHIWVHGDFRDRLGYLIADGPSSETYSWIDDAASQIILDIGSSHPQGDSTGRLQCALMSEALSIVRRPSDPARRQVELQRLVSIDCAHLNMLIQAGVLTSESARPILTEATRLMATGFGELLNAVAPRGLYSLYESQLVSRLGVSVAGVVHTARSRNDIQACLNKFESRDLFSSSYRALWRLRYALLQKARQTQADELPVFSQFQPAQPGNFSYYLLSFENALSRDQAAMCELIDSLNTSPMGACAGAGTDFPIQPQLTAELLGFSRTFETALDAIASRDLSLRLLSCLAVSGTNLSRLAQDFQLWTMGNQAMISLPDSLCGGSSIMPQKRNPYLLEIVKGYAISIAASLNHAIMSFQKTPFSNSIEVGSEGVSQCVAAAESFVDSCDLLRLMVQHATSNTDAMKRTASEGFVWATQMANEMTRKDSLNFHEAHRKLGTLISQSSIEAASPGELESGFQFGGFVDLAELRRQLQYGNGPGCLPKMFLNASTRLRRDSLVLPKLTGQWSLAECNLRSWTQSVIEGETPSDCK